MMGVHDAMDFLILGIMIHDSWEWEIPPHTTPHSNECAEEEKRRAI